MSWSRHALLAGALVLVGLLATIAVVFATRGSVREHIKDNYTLVRTTDGGRSAEYRSDDRPSAVAASIAGKWKPSERLSDPSGFFLRYRNDIVAVTNAPDGGSSIHVDDERRGYTRWYPYIGGYWGTYSGPGEGFRGGGPGVGK
jgi:hypothetical protein